MSMQCISRFFVPAEPQKCMSYRLSAWVWVCLSNASPSQFLLPPTVCHRETRDKRETARRRAGQSRAEQAAWQDEAEEGEEVEGEVDAAVEEVVHSRRARA